MQSTGSQADMCDNVDLSETLRSFHTQAQDLFNKTASLIDQLQSRGESISQSDALLERLQSRVNEMVITGNALEDAIQDGNQFEDDSSEELDDLIAERGMHLKQTGVSADSWTFRTSLTQFRSWTTTMTELVEFSIFVHTTSL